MSSENDLNPSTTAPRQQTWKEKIYDQGFGMFLAGEATALEQHRRMLHRTAQKDIHGYNAMAKAAGQDPLPEDDGEDSMGDINVSGDHHTTHVHPEPQQPQSPALPKWVLPTVGAALTAGGLGLGTTLGGLFSGDSSPPAVEQQDPREFEIGLLPPDR